MPKFLALFTGTPGAAMPDDKAMAAGMQAWGDWANRYAAQIVDGGPLGRTKRVTKNGVADIRNAMGAYTVVEAETHEAAAAMFENHPHFTIFPGDGVEIMPCLPVPGQ